MTKLKKGMPIIGADGKPIVGSNSEKNDNNVSQAKKIISDESQLLDAVAELIKRPSIIPHPERMLCVKVKVEEFTSAAGIMLPSAYQANAERAGRHGKTAERFRLFVASVGSKVNEYLHVDEAYDEEAKISSGDEIFMCDYDGLEERMMPFVMDFDKKYNEDNLFYSIHYTEIHGWKPQPVVRKAFNKCNF